MNDESSRSLIISRHGNQQRDTHVRMTHRSTCLKRIVYTITVAHIITNPLCLNKGGMKPIKLPIVKLPLSFPICYCSVLFSILVVTIENAASK